MDRENQRLKRLLEVFHSDCSIGDGMRSMIALLSEQIPHEHWEAFKKCEYSDNLERVYQWYRELLRRQPPKLKLQGLWFGIFNPYIEIDGEEKPSCAFYFSGSKRYQKYGSISWASGPEYFPEDRYGPLGYTDAIYRNAYNVKNGLGNEAENYLCLAYVGQIAKRLLSVEENIRALVGSEQIVGVAIGWDSGSPVYLGELSRSGLELYGIDEQVDASIEEQRKFERRQARDWNDLDEKEFESIKVELLDFLSNDDPHGALEFLSSVGDISAAPEELCLPLADYVDDAGEDSQRCFWVKKTLQLAWANRTRVK